MYSNMDISFAELDYWLWTFYYLFYVRNLISYFFQKRINKNINKKIEKWRNFQ